MKEAQAILGLPLEIADIDPEEIQSLDSTTIVTHKVRQAFERVKKPVFVEDVAVHIDAWGGFPGPFIKFILKAGGNALLLKMLSDEKNRKAVARCTIGYHDGNTAHTFVGEMNGTIAFSETGKNGFGWDPIFIPEGMTKTLAELSAQEKNEISNRKKALVQLQNFIVKNNI